MINYIYSNINKKVKDFLYYYPKKSENQESEPKIIEANEYILGKNILGLASIYKRVIFILDKLHGELRDKVIEHEKHHLENIADSEYTTRLKTNTLNMNLNPELAPSYQCSY